MNFGDKEGLHFDGLLDSEKAEINSPDFKAQGGESYHDVRARTEEFFGTLEKGNHLVFTHGATITTSLQDHGIETMPTNLSLIHI